MIYLILLLFSLSVVSCSEKAEKAGGKILCTVNC